MIGAIIRKVIRNSIVAPLPPSEPAHQLQGIPVPSFYGLDDMYVPVIELMVPRHAAGRQAFQEEYIAARRNFDRRWIGAALLWVAEVAERGYSNKSEALNRARNIDDIRLQDWGMDMAEHESPYSAFDMLEGIRKASRKLGIDFHDAFVWALLEESRIGTALFKKHAPEPMWWSPQWTLTLPAA